MSVLQHFAVGLTTYATAYVVGRAVVLWWDGFKEGWEEFW